MTITVIDGKDCDISLVSAHVLQVKYDGFTYTIPLTQGVDHAWNARSYPVAVNEAISDAVRGFLKG